MKRENYAAAKKLVAASRRILVSGHLSPDGDSLGSMIALARLLRNAGYEAYATADLNALGNKHIGKNLRILLINNGCGAEFKLSTHYGSQFGDQTDDYIAAGHHFGDKSPDLVKHFVTDLGFKYLTASTREELVSCADEFVSPVCDKPILLECFTTPKDESNALEMLADIDPYVSAKSAIKSVVKSVLPNSAVEMIKDMFK